ncbi:10223_t:CDS:10, partial [Acaulospora morrowiae]
MSKMFLISLPKCFSLLIITLSLYWQVVCGLYEDQAGINDWHHQYIGTPKFSFFHKVPSRGSVILVASERNVIASISPRNGNIADSVRVTEWRQVLEDDEVILAYKSHQSSIVSVSHRDGYNVRLLEAHTGFMIWEQKIKPIGHDDVVTSRNFEDDAPKADVVFTADSGIVILVEGSTIVNLNSTTGRQIWSSSITDSSSLFYKLVEREQNVFAIGLKKSFRSYTIEVVTCDIRSGALKSTSLSSKIDHIKNMLVLGGGPNSGFVVWVEGKHMRVNRLGSSNIEQAPLETLYGNVIPSFAHSTGKLELIDLNLGSRTEFLAQIQTKDGNYSAAVLKVDPVGGRLLVLHDMEDREGISAYSGTFDKNERLIMSRVRTVQEGQAVIEIVAPASHEVISVHKIPYSISTSGVIKKATVLDVLAKTSNEKVNVAYRMYAISDDGSTHFLKKDEIVWQKEESLAHATEVEFLDLPERKLWTQEVDELAEQPEEAETISPFARYVRRLKTHFEQLHDLPNYLITYVQRFVTGDYSQGPTSAKLSIYRDTFGFRKLLIFITRKKVIALDTSNKGQIVWSRYFGNEVFEFQRIFTVRSSTVKFPPIVVTTGIIKHTDGSIFTRLFRLNALTGEDFIPTENALLFPSTFDVQGSTQKIFKLPLEEPEERTHILALIVKEFLKFAPSFYFALSGSNNLKGYGFVLDKNNSLFEIDELWNIEFPEGDKIAAIGHRPQHEKVASLGRVLGDRSVFYKYLNPHLVAVATISSSVPANLNIHLIDIVKGTILYQATHDNVGSSHPVLITQVENTILYHYWKDCQSEKGYEVVVYDLYESENKDERFN